ncbi:tyrosine-type recombinase/integrase [Pseudolysinimonas sp.]|jgi:site-specific recombinase XerD|uniref:tyrosine-type recombinase/integrase n=1 Tax=Pseudolysinimonas sp. TaxID=2680009 RepID=UPI0037840134
MTAAPADPRLDPAAAQRTEDVWATALDEHRGYLAQVDGLAESTVTVRMRMLSAMARSIGLGPWALSDEAFSLWLDQRGLARESQRTYRKVSRGFYRWAVAVGYIERQPLADRPTRVRRAPEGAWSAGLEEWEVHESRVGASPEYVRTRAKHLRRFADECGVASPWNVEPAHVHGWLARLNVSGSTVAAARNALRSFYRWACHDGRIEHDPTDEPSRRASTRFAPERWEVEISAWRRAMLAESKPSTTLMLRVQHLRRFARENSHLAPFEPTTDELLDWLSHKRWSPETRRSVRGSLRGFYRWAKQSGRVAKNPAAKLPAVKAPLSHARPAADADYRAALAKADRSERMALRLAAELGLRRAEVAVVHTSDLRHTETGMLILVHGKGRRDRVLPVPQSLADSLRAVTPGFVFPGKIDGHISPQYLSKRLGALLPPGVSMHMLRHRFATNAYAVDRDVLTVQRLLGHSSPATTQRYVAVTDDRMRELVEAIAS